MHTYPKLVYKGRQWRKVFDAAQEQDARADGWGDTKTDPVPVSVSPAPDVEAQRRRGRPRKEA